MKRNTVNFKCSAVATNAMRPIAAALATLFLSMPAVSGITIPDYPLQSSAPVAPNIMFILDDSGSMGNTFMPAPEATSDAAPSTSAPNIGPQTYARNGIYYNPATEYDPWKTANGTPLVDTPYGAVYNDGKLASAVSGVTNLASAIQVYYVPKTADKTLAYVNNPANYYKYALATNGEVWRSERLTYVGPTPPNNTAAHGCDTSTAGVGWRGCTRVTPTGRSEPAERQNFATWYSFHRTRTKTAKAGASDAFSDLGSNYRVGFTTIWGGNLVGPTRTPFNIPVTTDSGLFRDNALTTPVTYNRTTWYNNLQKADANGSTPLQGALQTAGNYFSRTDSAGPYGPDALASQLACRQNFAILTTDGFWNSQSGYNTAVNNADNSTTGAVPLPPGSTITPVGYSAVNPYKDNWSNTLADIANYYWKTDLRTDLDNIVPQSTGNPAYWQHMVTYGISIGLQGTLDPVLDLPKLTAGTPNTNGTTGWPDPTITEDPRRIDDLFHASVNGHGKFIAATNATEFKDGLRAALESISSLPASNSNASANSTSLDDGSLLFQAKYFPSKWAGELDAYTIVNGDIGATPTWKASANIPVYTSRNILTWDGLGGSTFPTSAQSTTLGTGVVNYIRGERNNERSATNPTGPYRNRIHLLGDIVNSSPAYVKQTNSIYVGANDGMLHAFDSITGVEQFAYIPGSTNLTDLALFSDLDYSHRYFVDGAVVVSTRAQTTGVSNFIAPNNNKNILVGALGRGGKGVFALDVTTPTAMTAAKVKWESATDSGMGNVLGRSFIAKLNNGMSAVIVANGPNSNDERAELFIYNLNTGALIANIDTGVGSAATPNGLSSPIGWDDDNDGDIDYVYSGDLLGNMWKFDIGSGTVSNWTLPANRKVLYAATDGGTPVKRQPITGRPTIARDPSTYKRWVFFGTGQFLAATDPASKDIQSWYGIIDEGSVITGRTDLAQRKIAVTGTITTYDTDGVTVLGITKVRGFEPAAALTAGKLGWYLDFITPPTPPGTKEGERMVGDQRLFDTILIAPSIIPSTDQCLPGGGGFVNAIDAFTGTSISTGFFDVNGDGDFTNDNVGTGGALVPVGSIDFRVGMGTNPVIGNGKIFQCGSAADCNKGNTAQSNRIGRISWREILGN